MKHRPRGCCAERFERFAADPAENAQRVPVGMLPLARPHADRGEALQQLAAVEALLTGIHEILYGEIFVEVDEFPATRMREDRMRVIRALDERLSHTRGRLAAEAETGCGLITGRTPIGEPLIEPVHAVHLAAGIHPRRERRGEELRNGWHVAELR